ncbi:hypothetical protein [Sphingomonas sp. AX6]|uniref:hypothetical protein n=1 Tax=Sphingomonas sp. AX6 TaxID=2653171 RepID=UPI0012F08D89|nr:hypothetical protein [Sphingomonas sp. AX6]VXC98998.1 conserved hypothetical protein [Sphingomonas sp. AX6]
MLTLKLDELFGPKIVAAFQAQWSSEPDAALAQAERAVRMIVAPKNESERSIARLVLALVGPEPDGLAWLEALAVGSFQLRENVSYAIGRVGESPSKFIDRQRERIRSLADHPKAKGREKDYENAYLDALRLVVATTLLVQMRTGVAAKAAIGPAWPLMVAVDAHLKLAEKRALFIHGNDAALQAGIADAVRTLLADYAKNDGPQETRPSGQPTTNLPPGADVISYFRNKEEQRSFEISPELRRKRSPTIPQYILEASPNRSRPDQSFRISYRVNIHMVCLEEARTGKAAFSLALRSESRRVARENWRQSTSSGDPPHDFDIQCAIWDHIRAGGYFPLSIPVDHIRYLEEDACWHFNELGDAWVGLEKWRQGGFFRFERDPLSVDGIEI